jgi:hypothetical protein
MYAVEGSSIPEISVAGLQVILRPKQKASVLLTFLSAGRETSCEHLANDLAAIMGY